MNGSNGSGKIRNTVASTGQIVTDAANLATIPPNANRVGIIFANLNAGVTMVWQFRETPTATNGMPLAANVPQELYDERGGTGIRDQIRILGTAAGQVVGFVQFIQAP